MPSLAPAFNAITTKPATVTRPGAATYVDGYSVRAADQTFAIRASIQPLTSANQNEWMRLPEGVRNEAECFVYTRFALQSGDMIEASGARFRVLSLDKWAPLGGYTKAILGGMKP